jgi:hypothetical protein
MGLRFLLVGLVASLGIDLPTRRDLSEWTHGSRTWLCVQLDEWNAWDCSGPALRVAAPRATTTEAAPTLAAAPTPETTAEVVTDVEFTALLDEMITDFAPADAPLEAEPTAVAEQPSPESSAQPDPAAPVAAASASPAGFEPLEVGDDLYPGMAYALNFASEGLGVIEPVAPLLLEPRTEGVPAAALAATPAPAFTLTPVCGATPVADADFIVDAPEVLAVEPRPACLAAAEEEAATIADAPDAPAVAVAAAVENTPAGAADSTVQPRVRRLATAFRLTGEAFLAWSKLIEAPAVVSIHP